MTRASILLVAISFGCSSPAASSPDAAIDSPSPPLPDAAPSYAPPVIPDLGGPVLMSPTITTVMWQGDPLATELHAFDAWYVQSATWTQTLAQYRVGAGQAPTTWTVPATAPATIDDTELQTLLRDAIAQGSLAHPTANTLFTIYPPAATTVTHTFGSTVYRSCETFSGYHGSTALADGTPVYYAVAARCPAAGTFTQLDMVTVTASHELAEATTDPDLDHPAWRLPYDPNAIWIAPFGGEIGDLCEGYPLTIEGHVVTALYSNDAATHGQRTCVPAPPGPMYAAASQPHALTMTATGGDASVTIWSPDPTVHGLHLAMYSIPQGLTITPATHTVAAGDQLAIHLSRGPSTPPGPYIVVMNLSDATYASITFLIATAP